MSIIRAKILLLFLAETLLSKINIFKKTLQKIFMKIENLKSG